MNRPHHALLAKVSKNTKQTHERTSPCILKGSSRLGEQGLRSGEHKWELGDQEMGLGEYGLVCCFGCPFMQGFAGVLSSLLLVLLGSFYRQNVASFFLKVEGDVSPMVWASGWVYGVASGWDKIRAWFGMERKKTRCEQREKGGLIRQGKLAVGKRRYMAGGGIASCKWGRQPLVGLLYGLCK